MTGDHFLAPFWQDAIAVAGFLGVLVTILALVIAICQLVKTKNASRAFTEAASKTVDELRERYTRYLISDAHRLLIESKMLVASDRWENAAMRLADLAHIVVQVRDVDAQWVELADTLRGMEISLRRIAKGEIRFTNDISRKWNHLHQQLAEKISRNDGPFVSSQGSTSNDARRTV
jgi:uncharacterized membrane protein